MSESSAKGGGLTFCGALALLFIGLKLTDHVDWSWLWVLSPLWIPIALVFIVIGGIFLGIIAATAVDVVRVRLEKK